MHSRHVVASLLSFVVNDYTIVVVVDSAYLTNSGVYSFHSRRDNLALVLHTRLCC